VKPSLTLLFLAGLASCGAPVPEQTDEAPTNEAPETTRSETDRLATRIPAPFQGRFDRSAEDCAAASPFRLVVTERTLRFHESLGTVTRIQLAAEDRTIVSADYQGEGESWSATQELRLSDGGERLTIIGPAEAMVRVRCAGPETRRSNWDHAASGEGDALSLMVGGERRLTLFCPADSAELIVNVPAFRPIASEERMSFGAGGIVVTLVADVAGDRLRGGVSGRASLPSELESILAQPEGIAANYGAQNEGPHPAPAADLAASFLAGCRD
jgi:hypothetical protein